MKNTTLVLLAAVAFLVLAAYRPTTVGPAYDFASIIVRYTYDGQAVHITDNGYRQAFFPIKKLQLEESVPIPPEDIRFVEDSAAPPVKRLKSPGEERSGQVRLLVEPAPAPEPSVPSKEHIILSMYDNTHVFQLLHQYQAAGWELLDSEWGMSGAQFDENNLVSERVMVFLLRRKKGEND